MKRRMTILMTTLLCLGATQLVQAQERPVGTMAFVISGVDGPELDAIVDWPSSLGLEDKAGTVQLRSEISTSTSASEIHHHVAALASRPDVLMVMVVTPTAFSQIRESKEAINPLVAFPGSFGPFLDRIVRRNRDLITDMRPLSSMGPLSAKRIYVGDLPLTSMVNEDTGNVGNLPSPYILMMPTSEFGPPGDLQRGRIIHELKGFPTDVRCSEDEWEKGLVEIGVDVDYEFKDWFMKMTAASYDFLLNALDDDDEYQGTMTGGGGPRESR